MKAPLPENEAARLRALHAHQILDTAPEQVYDDIVRLAAIICGTPIAIMSLVDSDRQWFKAKVGIQAVQSPRDEAFCAYTILDPGTILVVPDATKDKRFADNPHVINAPGIRFYAGSPLVDLEGNALGALCVIDRKPREITADQKEALRMLARHMIVQIELSKRIHDLARFQKLSVGREIDMIRLKNELNDLLQELGRPPRFNMGQKSA